MDIERNSGFRQSSPTESDYIAGIKGTIQYEAVNESGDWEPFLPAEEAQNSVYFDALACVSFSANNVVETQLNWMIATGQLPERKIKWLRDNGYIVDGKVELCDRYLAKVSGTTRQGNTLQNVASAFRHFGAIPEKDWPYPRAQRTPVFDWDDYYAEIPQALIDKGIEFLKVIGEFPDYKETIQYEWVFESVEKHLKQAPLQLAVTLCPGWNTGSVPMCAGPVAHAIELYRKDTAVRIFDTYAPYKKALAADYLLPFVFKIIIKQNTMVPYELIKRPGTNEIYAKKGTVIRHIAGMQTLKLGGQEPDKLWVFNDTPGEAETIHHATSAEWATYTEGSEIHLDPKD